MEGTVATGKAGAPPPSGAILAYHLRPDGKTHAVFSGPGMHQCIAMAGFDIVLSSLYGILPAHFPLNESGFLCHHVGQHNVATDAA
jgi:hypothetical protein